MSAISSLNTRLPRCVTFTPFTWPPGMAGRLMLSGVSAGKSRIATMRCSSARRPSRCVSSMSPSVPAYETAILGMPATRPSIAAGIPSIAVSYAGTDVDMLETHRDGLRALLQRIVAVRDFPAETLLNINLPAIPGDQVKGVKVTHLGSRVFSEEIALMKDPWGKEI